MSFGEQLHSLYELACTFIIIGFSSMSVMSTISIRREGVASHGFDGCRKFQTTVDGSKGLYYKAAGLREIIEDSLFACLSADFIDSVAPLFLELISHAGTAFITALIASIHTSGECR